MDGAIFGLLGVILGAAIGLWGTYVVEKRRIAHDKSIRQIERIMQERERILVPLRLGIAEVLEGWESLAASATSGSRLTEQQRRFMESLSRFDQLRLQLTDDELSHACAQFRIPVNVEKFDAEWNESKSNAEFGAIIKRRLDERRPELDAARLTVMKRLGQLLSGGDL